MSTMCTISDVQEYQSDILEYGIQDFDNYFTKATNDILRMLQIDWWMVERSKGRGTDLTVGTAFADFDTTKLDYTQFTRMAVFVTLGRYVYPALASFQPEGDKFAELMKHYNQEADREFEFILRRGVRYDFDGDSVYQTEEQRPVNFGELIR